MAPAERSLPDPSTLLGVPEAARLVGVPRARLEQALDEGRVLFETERRRGKEVRRVRVVDLLEAFPPAGSGAPGPAGEGRGDAAERASAAHPQVPRGVAAGTPAGGEPAPETHPRGSSAPTPPEGEDLRGARALGHALEVRVAALQSANDALRSQVEELHQQRGDWRSQCEDLRARLTVVERERQAGTAGLLLAQKRLMELEAAVPPPPPVWRRATVSFAVVGVLALLGWVLRVQVVEAGRLERERDSLGGEVQDLDRDLQHERVEAAREREAFGQRVEGLLGTLESLQLEVRRSEDDRLQERARLERELQAAREEARETVEALVRAREVQDQAHAQERERGAQALEQSGAVLEELRVELLDARGEVREERERSRAEREAHAAELARLERERREAQEREARLLERHEEAARRAEALGAELERELRALREAPVNGPVPPDPGGGAQAASAAGAARGEASFPSSGAPDLGRLSARLRCLVVGPAMVQRVALVLAMVPRRP